MSDTSTSVPNRQRSLKDRLKDGIAQSWPRRRGSQGSNPSKGSRPYFIPTAGKTGKSVDTHGLVNPSDFERTSANNTTVSVGVDGGNVTAVSTANMATSAAAVTTSHLTKTANEPSENSGQRCSMDEKKRSVVQPPGTFIYTVGRNDTLTSIAAHYETTPSELVKINRLVSRLIFPGQPLFVPDNSGSENSVYPLNQDSKVFIKSDSPVNGIGINNLSDHGSPKPGRAERVQSPSTSPTRSVAKGVAISKDSTDRVRTQKFLKINVKHITDGQGVVSGVLLVTPNAVMFDPSVMDALVMEHGADKYGVIAPMDYVANAALYSDIAHMRVKNAPQNLLPHPEIYHIKTCPMYKGEGSELEETEVTESVAGQPSRSESQQAVKGSISDKAELSDGDDDEDVDNARDGEEGFGAGSVCSCQTESKGSDIQTPDDNSEVFAPEDQTTGSREVEKMYPARKTLSSSTNVSFESMETEAGGKRIERVPLEDSDVAVVAEKPLPLTAQLTEIEGAQTEVILKDTVLFTDLPNGQLISSKEPCTVHRKNRGINSGPHSLMPFVVEGLKKSLSQSASASDDDSDGGDQLHNNNARKHSIPDVQLSTEKLRLKMLKRLSYPLWNTTDAYSDGKEPKQEDSDEPITLSTSLSEGVPIKSPINDSQTTLSRILNSASPRNIVDFSTGIFMKSADCVGKVADVSQLPKLPPSWIPPPSPNLDGWVETTKNLLTGGRRGSTSPDQDLCEARNPNVSDFLFFGGGSAAGGRVEGKRGSRVEFKNEVADKLELFQTLDKLIPRPAQSCEDPPLYLCLRMGRPLHKKITSTTPTMSYGRRKMKSEYWFSIPKDRVDDLYSFFQHWAPGVYGEINEVDLEERGFKLIEPDDDVSDEDEHRERVRSKREQSDDIDINRRRSDSETPGSELPSWERLIMRLRRENKSSDSEIVSALDVAEHEDMIARQMSLDMESLLPELIGQTEILTEDHRREIRKCLPARAFGYAWSLIFSASQHGFSLQSMYRRMAHFETPVLLVIQDTENNVFGAMTSESLKVSDHFYGTGESFLYTFYPEFKVFKWSGENVFFIKGNQESLAIGAGDGVFGLWLDGDLYHGRSHSCKTYNNDMLTSDEDFCIKTIEAWGYVEFGAMDSTC